MKDKLNKSLILIKNDNIMAKKPKWQKTKKRHMHTYYSGVKHTSGIPNSPISRDSGVKNWNASTSKILYVINGS